MTAQPLSSLQPPACLADDICTTISTLLRSQVGRRSQNVQHGALELLESSLHGLTSPYRKKRRGQERISTRNVLCTQWIVRNNPGSLQSRKGDPTCTGNVCWHFRASFGDPAAPTYSSKTRLGRPQIPLVQSGGADFFLNNLGFFLIILFFLNNPFFVKQNQVPGKELRVRL